MVGANYMGGGRNTARTRAKDSIGRIQKGFFGRQRLDILSKGLAANRSQGGNDLAVNGNLKSRAEISLAHARNLLSDDVNTVSFIPGPYDVPSSSPRAQEYRGASRQGSKFSGTRTSKVLDILDTSEAIFIRGILDKILDMPDLAGISKCQTRAVESSSRRGDPRSQLTKSGHTSIPTQIQRPSSPCDTIVVEGQSFSSVRGILSDAHTSTILPSSSPPTSYFSSELPVCSSSSEHYESMDVDINVDMNVEKAFSDNGYLDFEAGLESQALVSAGGTSNPSSPNLWSKPPAAISRERPRISSPRLRSFRILESPPRPAVHNLGDPNYPGEDDSLQEYCQSELGPPQNDLFASVFESEDPWNAIGTILGLPKFMDKQTSESDLCNSAEMLLFPRNSQHEASSYLCEDSLMELLSDLGADETGESYSHTQDSTEATTNEYRETERSERFVEHKKITKIPIASRFGGESVDGKPQVRQLHVQFSGLSNISLSSVASPFSSQVADDSSTADIDENMAAPSDPLTSPSNKLRPSWEEEEAVAAVELNSRIDEKTLAVEVPLPNKIIVLTPEQDEVDGVFEGPCLFSNDSDDSDEDI